MVGCHHRGYPLGAGARGDRWSFVGRSADLLPTPTRYRNEEGGIPCYHARGVGWGWPRSGLWRPLTILSFASRAFAFYYFLQCLVAICVTKKTWQKVAISFLAVVLAFITLFAVPAG